MAGHQNSSGRDVYNQQDDVSPTSSFDHSERPSRGPLENDIFLVDMNNRVGDDGKTPQTGENKKNSSSGFWGIWWPELIACFLVVGSFCALIATLYHYHNRPLPKLPYGLSINTLVSIYTIIFDTALMMIVSSGWDNSNFYGSKRPGNYLTWKYLTKVPRAHGGLLSSCGFSRQTSLGALIIILLLFVAPLNQQLVRYYPCAEIDTTATASISRTNIADSTGEFHTGALTSNIDLAAQAAIQVGILDTKPAAMSPTCMSGNCTFPFEYSSAGYCSVCKDYTDHIQARNISTYTKLQNISVDGWTIESDGGPYGFVLGTPGYKTSFTNGPGVQIIFGRGNATDRKEMNNACEGGIAASNWTCLGFGAAECHIVPCARRYKANVTAGNFYEEILSQTTDMGYLSDGSVGRSTIDMECVNDVEKDFLRKNYIFDNSTQWLPYNLSKTIFTSRYNGSQDIRDECIYQGSSLDSSSLSDYFATFFNGGLWIVTQYIGSGNTNAGKALFNMGRTNFTFIESKFDSLANAMTVYTRNRVSLVGANSTVPVQGQVLKETSCVVIRWPWLTLEAVLLGLSAGFFTTTVWAVGKADGFRHDFKTSVLPLLYLFHGMDGDVQKPSSGVNTMNGIHSHAEGMRVRLARDEKGWGFRGE